MDEEFAVSLRAEMRLGFRSDTVSLDISKAHLPIDKTAATAGIIEASSFHHEQGTSFTIFDSQS